MIDLDPGPGASDLLSQMQLLQRTAQPFALATVVRTISVTAAKAGAKAIVRADGTVTGGWIGGGCAKGAVVKAAREALADGHPRLVSIQPADLLADLGVTSGEARSGINYATNMCPSQGTMDIFIEPMLPRPELVIMGASPVAIALAEMAAGFNFFVRIAAPPLEHCLFHPDASFIDGYRLPPSRAARYIVVATQGSGDMIALTAALAGETERVSFVGSRRKAAALSLKLAGKVDEARLIAIKAPAGLDIGAIAPSEIALSILAELVAWRRKDQRGTSAI